MSNNNFIPLLLSLSLLGCGETGPHADISCEGYGWRGGLYGVWEPAEAHAVMIVHQGHDKFDAAGRDMREVAMLFRDNGFLVYGFEMPCQHDDWFKFEHMHGPLEDFYQPVIEVIDTIPADLSIYMMGLSGGGWTTTVVTALSERIVRGYSISGDAPLDVWMYDALRGITGRDWEQLQIDYRDYYALAGERLMHIYIYNDTCCFWGIEGDIGYPYVTDPTAQGHELTPWAVNYILNDINLSEGT